jgi:lipoprotein-releasing system permease protein
LFNLTLLSFFFRRLTAAENRNGAIILGAFGLFFSSAALFVLLTIMGGLQEKMKERSQKIFGHYSLLFTPAMIKTPLYEGPFVAEWEEEMMVRFRSGLSAVVVHGIQQQFSSPEVLPIHSEFLQQGAVIGRDLAYELGIDVGDTLVFFSPRYLDLVFGEVPRQLKVKVSLIKDFSVPEADRFHVWMRLPLLQNLTRQHGVNRLRFSSEDPSSDMLAQKEGRVLTWSEENQTLERSLQLESRVMLFLFSLMTVLVGVGQFAGLLLVGQTLRPQLMGLWISGEPVRRLIAHLVPVMLFLFVTMTLCGLLFGSFFALVLQHFSPHFMPDIFVERGLPLQWSWKTVALSAGIPLLQNMVLCAFYYRHLTREWNFLSDIRVQQN